MLVGKGRARDRFSARVGANKKMLLGAGRIRGIWRIKWRDKNGVVKADEEFTNLIVNQGLDHLLDVELSAATQVTSWFVALLKGSPSPAAGWTYANTMGTGNEEVTAYDEANRPAWSDAGVSGQSVSNAASPATFTISADTTTIGGCALVSNNTKNDSGAGPILYAAGVFAAGNKVLDDDDTIDVTATFTMADDGA